MASVRSGARRPSRREQLAQVGALDVVHADEEQPVDLAGLEERHDVGVVEDAGQS
jgi:hypothetical protein